MCSIQLKVLSTAGKSCISDDLRFGRSLLGTFTIIVSESGILNGKTLVSKRKDAFIRTTQIGICFFRFEMTRRMLYIPC